MPLRTTEWRTLDSRVSSRRIYLEFVALSLVASVIVGAVAVVASRARAVEHEKLEAHVAIEHVAFELVASARSDGSVPDDRRAHVSEDLVHGLGAAHMTEVMVVDRTKTVVYALDPSLIGRPSPRCVTEHNLLEEGSTVIHPVDAEEVGLDSLPSGRLMAAVTSFHSSAGEPLLLAAFGAESAFVEGWVAELVELAPPALLAILLLQMINFPLAWSLAKRTRADVDEHSRLLVHALRSGDLERRRIAQDLHDTVIPDLAGVSYAMESAGPGATATSAALLARARGVLARDLAFMRTLLASMLPAPVEHEPFAEAVEALLGPLEEAGVTADVTVDRRVDDAERVAPSSRLVAYRLVREGLRNVVRHAKATTVQVEVTLSAQVLTVRVADDGVGMIEGEPSTSVPGDHVGLDLLRDAVAEIGGRVIVERAVGMGTGTVLTAVLPAR